MKKFFETAKDLIERRGKFMTAMLMIQDEKPELYTKIQGRFFNDNDVEIKSISDAAKKIIKAENEFEDKIPDTAKVLLGELEKGKV